METFKDQLGLDLGHYPLTPWLNKEGTEDKRKVQYFMPPRPREDLFSVRQGECSSDFIISK
jgi:hypothetical protein